jgi:hypothetical protein
MCLLLLGGLTAPAAASDLAKIDRTLFRAPDGLKGTARYCVLVFGKEAKTRVWLIMDDQHLYIDRNGNGDLTEANERLPLPPNNGTIQAGDILDANGRLHKNLRIFRHHGKNTCHLMIQTRGKNLQYVGFREMGSFRFGASLADAPVVHFDGPICLAPYPQQDPLLAHPNAFNEVNVMIGTPGLGEASFASYHCNVRYTLGRLEATYEYLDEDKRPRNIIVKAYPDTDN